LNPAQRLVNLAVNPGEANGCKPQSYCNKKETQQLFLLCLFFNLIADFVYFKQITSK
jgi:hypothetical protein